MEQRGSRVTVVAGLFVFVGLLLLAASIFLLGERGRYFSTQHSLKAFFTKVGGLHEGAAVRLAGVAVGRVTRIQLPRPPEEKVLVELNVAGRAIENVRRDSVARIETLGFLGDKFIEIRVGSSREPRLPDGAILRVEEPTDFGALIGQGQRVLGHAEGVATSLDTMLSTLEKAKATEAIAEAARTLERIAASLERGKGALPWLIQDPASRQFVQDLGRTAETLAALSNEVKEGRGLSHVMIYDQEGGKLVEESRDLVKNLTEASQRLNEISEKIARGDGTLGAFLVDPTLYEDLTALLEGTKRSWLLRSVIQSTLQSGRQAQKENAKESQ